MGLFTGIGAGIGSFWGPAGTAFGGGIGSGIDTMLGQQQANAQNREIMERQLQWTGEMSNTAHQREVKDLKAAGLNPILSVNAGASTPQAAGAIMQNEAEGLTTSARDAQQFFAEMKRQKSELALIDKQAEKAQAEKTKTEVETHLISKDLPKADILKSAWEKIRDIYNTSARNLKGDEKSKQRSKENMKKLMKGQKLHEKN